MNRPGSRCPRCGSPDPKKHPAVQFEGEVQVCPHPWHTPQPDTERGKAVVAALEDTIAEAVGETHYAERSLTRKVLDAIADSQWLAELVDAPGQSDLYLEAVVSVKAALALHAEHVRGLRGETECVCLGCQMARALRGEQTR